MKDELIQAINTHISDNGGYVVEITKAKLFDVGPFPKFEFRQGYQSSILGMRGESVKYLVVKATFNENSYNIWIRVNYEIFQIKEIEFKFEEDISDEVKIEIPTISFDINPSQLLKPINNIEIHVISIIIAFVGVALLLMAGFNASEKTWLFGNSIPVIANIIDKNSDENGTKYKLRYQFGRNVIRTDWIGGPSKYIGEDKMPLLINDEDLKNYVIDEPLQKGGIELILLLVGSGLICTTLLIKYSTRRNR